MNQTEFRRIASELVKKRGKKNSDYGNVFIDAYNDNRPCPSNLGDSAIYCDIRRKFARLETLLLTGKEPAVADETIEDTLDDLAITCMNIKIALRRREYGNNDIVS